MGLLLMSERELQRIEVLSRASDMTPIRVLKDGGRIACTEQLLTELAGL
jgi:hypothetical protein